MIFDNAERFQELTGFKGCPRNPIYAFADALGNVIMENIPRLYPSLAGDPFSARQFMEAYNIGLAFGRGQEFATLQFEDDVYRTKWRADRDSVLAGDPFNSIVHKCSNSFWRLIHP